MTDSRTGHATRSEMLSRRGLPEPAAPLVGRATEVVTAEQALTSGSVRLLTLTGTGGVGKTHLALAIGRTLAGKFADGVYWVDLAPLGNTQLVLPTIARTLGLTDPGQVPVREQVQVFLQPRHLLLILDNFEHLLEAAVDIGHLLSVCPAVRVLATSREPLHLSWEHEQPVPPLPVPPPTTSVDAEKLRTNPAVALFVSRAQAVRPDFRLEPSNSESVAELCRSLDGLPLALELAAAQIKSLPPAVLLTRLERRLDVLATPQRDRPARQHALRSAIGWSYDLLATAEQTVFRRLSVFSGGCTLDAAEAVASGDLATVASLIDKNLLRLQEHDQPGVEPRVRMLESVRVYGLEQLVVHGEFHAAHQQLAAACLLVVQQFERLWRGPDHNSGLIASTSSTTTSAQL
jgi:predicted ATPase